MSTTAAPSLLVDLEVAEGIIGDVAAFAAGQAVSASPTIAGSKCNVSVIHLPNGPTAEYPALNGNIGQEFLEALTLGAEFQAGAQASAGVKIVNSWYGISIQKTATQ